MANAQLESQINAAKSGGFNDQQIKSYLTQKGVNLSGTRYQGGVGGFINRNLSTIGAVALPAVADLVSGGLAIPADAALSAAGGGIGKAVSNATEGEKLGSGVGGATASSALGGLIGGVGGKVLSKTGSAVSDEVAKVASGKADQASAQKVAQDIAPFSNLHPTTLANNDLKGTMDLMKNKINMEPSPENMHKAASIVTGDNGVVSGVMHDVLAKAAPVDVGDVVGAAKSAVNSVENSPVLGDASTKGTPGNNLVNSLTTQKENGLLHGVGGTTVKSTATKAATTGAKIESKAAPADVFKGIQTLGGQIEKLGNAEPGSLGHATRNVLQAVKGHLEDKLYNDSGVNDLVKNSSFKDADPASQANIEHQVLRQGGTPELADHIISGINDAKTGQDLRALQAPFVRASNLASAADDYASGKGAVKTANEAAGQEPDVSGLGNAAHLGASVATGSHLGVANTLGNLIKKGATSDTVLNPASKITELAGKANNVLPGKGTTTALLANATGQGLARSGQSQPQNQTAQDATALQTSTDNSDSSDNSSATPQFTQNDLLASIAADPTHASTYEALYSALSKPESNLSAADQTNVSNIKDASSYLDTAEQELSQLGGAKGPIAGKEANIPIVGQYLQPQASAYNKTKVDVATSIAKALTGSKPAATIVKAYMDSLPAVTDTPQVAAQKIANVRLELSNKASDYGVSLSGK